MPMLSRPRSRRRLPVSLISITALWLGCGLDRSGTSPEADVTGAGAGGGSLSTSTTATTTTTSTTGAGGDGGGGGSMPCAPGATESCYEGPAGTENVGACTAGLRTCSGDGSAFGPCQDQVIPSGESCGTATVDADCDGAAPDCSTWAFDWGSNNEETAFGVAVTADGATYVTGSFEGTVSFEGAPLVSGGDDDVFLTKLGPGGEHLWSARYGDGSFQRGWAVAATPEGGALVAGEMWGAIDFGGGPFVSEGQDDVFIARLASNGAHVWTKRFGGSAASQRAYGVASLADGSAVVAGQFYGSISFGGPTFTSSGDRDGFVARLAADGTTMWANTFGDTGGDASFGVAADPAGNTVVAGIYHGNPDLGSGPLPDETGGTPNLLVVKYSPGGAMLWSRGIGTPNKDQYAEAVAVDSAGNVFIAGGTDDVDFGGPSGSFALDRYSAFVAKLDPSGNTLWSRVWQGSEYSDGLAVATDPSGNVFVTGWLSGTTNFGGADLTSAGNQDVFIVKLDGAGNHLFSQRYGDASWQQGWAIAVDELGSLRVAGRNEAGMDLFGQPLATAGWRDAFVGRAYVP